MCIDDQSLDVLVLSLVFPNQEGVDSLFSKNYIGAKEYFCGNHIGVKWGYIGHRSAAIYRIP
jgi:hypothetical protein